VKFFSITDYVEENPLEMISSNINGYYRR